VIIAVLLPFAAAQQESKKRERVRAKEPTTVTVYGKQDRVETRESAQDRNGGVVGGLKNVAAKSWNGLISFGGWLLNTDDDVPSERERRTRSQQEERPQK
jgi:hypothetical protein